MLTPSAETLRDANLVAFRTLAACRRRLLAGDLDADDRLAVANVLGVIACYADEETQAAIAQFRHALETDTLTAEDRDELAAPGGLFDQAEEMIVAP
jgi:hypothetical protein